MALEQAQAFISKLKEDTELQQKLVDVTKGQSEAMQQHIVEIGASSGYEFSLEELEEAWHQMFQQPAEGEIKEKELDNVVGGTITQSMFTCGWCGG